MVSAHAGTDQIVDRAELGITITSGESFDLYHIAGYASNGTVSNYLSAGLGSNFYIPNSKLFISPDIRLAVGEYNQTNQFGRQDKSLDIGAAYSFSIGIHLNKTIFIATGIEQFVATRDNISFNPLSIRYGF